MFALSKAGEKPGAYITWLQANTACRSSGKRLPTGDEWLEAARGTPDPTDGNDGLSNPLCYTAHAASSAPRNTGEGSGCQSAWGAEDMIGNAWEWTAEWYAGVGNNTDPYTTDEVWPFGDHDGTWNIASTACTDSSCVVGLPAATLRGGSRFNKQWSGVFALTLQLSPAIGSDSGGFRCVIPR